MAVAVLQNGVISRVRWTSGALPSDEEEPSCALAIINTGVVDLVSVAGNSANIQGTIVDQSRSAFITNSLQNIVTFSTDALIDSEHFIFAADGQAFLGLVI